MKRTVCHKILAPVLALLLLFAATPKDFLHDFTGHQDTVHRQSDDDGRLRIGEKHHHCSFLSLLALPFEGSSFEMQFVSRVRVLQVVTARPLPEGTGRLASSPTGRGPPAA